MHAKKQQKLSHKYNLRKEIINYNSKILLDSEIYNQAFSTEDKLIGKDKYTSGNYYRLFPIVGLTTETPFKLKKYNSNFTFSPKFNFTISP